MLTFLSKLYPFKYPFSSCRKYQLRISFFIKGIISLLKIFLSYLSSILSNTSSKPEFLEQKLSATRDRILSTSCQNLWWIFENPYLESINLEVFLFYFLNYTYCLTVDIKPKETNSSLIPSNSLPDSKFPLKHTLRSFWQEWSMQALCIYHHLTSHTETEPVGILSGAN